MKEYRRMVNSVVVRPKGEPTFSEWATTISVEDEGAGMYVVISQESRPEAGRIMVDLDEWQAVRAAVDLIVEIIEQDEAEIREVQQ